MENFKYEDQGLLHEMFMRQAKETPDRIAVVSPGENRQLTYKELDDVTDVLATNMRINGVREDCIVGIYMEKCLNYTISYIAALKAGGAYMPIDISYPSTLIGDILSDAQPTIVCVASALASNLPDNQKVIVMDVNWVETLKKANAEHPPFTSPPVVTLDSLAYVVYSSGTTGRPKGIQCPHRGSVFSYHHRHLFSPYSEDDQREASNIFFTWEMLRPLLKGATMFIVPDTVIYDPVLLCQFLEEHRISRILFTPSLLEAVLDADGVDVAHSLSSMRVIIFCGEVVTTGLLERCMKVLPSVRFLNLYSISEAHDVTIGDLSECIRDKKFCPVGKLLPSVQVVIFNDEMQAQPVGVAGEIYIGGPTLARGYLNRPELNKTRFIMKPDGVPDKVPDRLYKAGDWGYLLSDGSFEICGRCDSMVKIRGYSIEIQAVEAALLNLPMVKACVVLVEGEEGQDKNLVAYVVPESQENVVTKKEVRASLKKHLPFYMIPSYFVFLESIPLLAASGKLDKKALPPIEKSEGIEVDPEGLPTTPTEKSLVPLWADILSLKSVDIHESFFDLGGHSLLATKLLSRVRSEFNVELAVHDLFIHSSVSAMAKVIDSHAAGNANNLVSPVPTVDLLKEVATFWRGMQYGKQWNKAQVLLTGATGFLGAFLLRDLLLTTKCHVYCLLRESPDMTEKQRLLKTLEGFGIVKKEEGLDDKIRARFESRVTCVAGDVGLVNMGLSEDGYAYLCSDVDAVIHAAAYVNLIYPYQALHGPNVLGTQNIIQFAWTNKIKPLYHISTDAVFPAGEQSCSETSDMNVYADRLTDGYSQSKWVGEQLVLKAIERGLPAAVYRLGNLSGESEHGVWNPQDFNLLMIQGCLNAGMAPKIPWDVEMTPVNFVSSFIVDMTQRLSLVLGKIFHLMNCNTVKSQWLFEWIHGHGYPLKMVPFETWVKRCVLIRRSDQGYSIRILPNGVSLVRLDESFFANPRSYTQENTEKVLEILGKSYPRITNPLLSSYFEGLSRRRVIPRRRTNTILDRPLEGKVAIVTGASSGIGAAISRQLAAAGASVAMAARREEKLEEIKDEIDSNGGISIAVKCDVIDRKQVGEMVERTETTLGPVDILVNNAGIMYYTMMKNLHEDQWDRQVDLNCKGPLNCVGAVLDGMLKRQTGHIVNITSDAARRGFAGLAVYSGTKFFLEGFSQALRCELAQTGVKVTTIQPGDVRTELFTHTSDEEARAAFDGSASTTILEPSDIGRAVVYAVTQPAYASVNEILIEPRGAPI
ncbi:hypothetical protein CAPTEDRAFT_168750 [Capitella teleta]|uniref:Carrier domain-containing protein n=1 Tax=Capitella teleta TaxID=283909 RepID=R7THH8_CAPTE|nr:hypothetical protein CAPTEDRAFT_168750 [Capitella teleta]|eukprot:ELT91031.1 hypothetical protein CAPTEDRAFT_168750 [Capitella teleta]